MQPNISVTDVVDDPVRDVIGGGLKAFNETAAGYSDIQPLAVLVRDPASNDVVGGAIGRTSLGLMFLDQFFLPEILRGSGLGSEVLRRFEDEGRRRGCVAGFLYSISFQAPGFYERNGWRRLGEIPCKPPGTSRVFLTKEL